MVERGLDPNHPQKKGFNRRHWTATPQSARTESEENSADLMLRACNQALSNARMSAQDIDVFIAVSTTSPRYTSSLGTLVGGRMGFRGPAFEMKSGCSGAIYAMSIAYQFLASGARTILIAAAETLSRVVSIESPLLYAAGDGAGALILQRVEDSGRGLLGGYLSSDGSFADSMGVPGILPPTREALDRGMYFMGQSDSIAGDVEPFWFEGQQTVMEFAELGFADLDMYIPHQTSGAMLDKLAHSMGHQRHKLFRCLDRYGNCGSATLPIAISEAMESGLKTGSLVLLNAVGGGLAWGSLMLRV
tara:strand:+ start:2362 stop:3273 length:912 start_codon:yes stop_codon:yes gene_type:complete